MNNIRAGIIGGGNIAEYHIRDMIRGGRIIPWALCDVDAESLERTGDAYGIPAERRFTDYKALLALPEVDMVSICTPNVTHFEIAMEAVWHKKAYALEKPVAMTLAEARKLNDATVAAGLANTVCFSYRYLPAVYQAKKLVESGALGKIYHVYAQYIEGKEDNEHLPLLWRYQKELAGSGSLGDLGSHTLDMIRYLVGDVVQVSGCSGILVDKREKLDGSGLGKVTTEDYFHAMARMQDDISATMTFTKFAWGRKNAHRLEIYGNRGGMIFTLEKGIDKLHVCLGEELGDSGDWTKMTLDTNVKSQIDCFADQMLGIGNATPATITDGYKVQAIMEAMLAANSGKDWRNVSDYT